MLGQLSELHEQVRTRHQVQVYRQLSFVELTPRSILGLVFHTQNLSRIDLPLIRFCRFVLIIGSGRILHILFGSLLHGCILLVVTTFTFGLLMQGVNSEQEGLECLCFGYFAGDAKLLVWFHARGLVILAIFVVH